jgi:chaperonin cofactor prefoldin
MNQDEPQTPEIANEALNEAQGQDSTQEFVPEANVEEIQEEFLPEEALSSESEAGVDFLVELEQLSRIEADLERDRAIKAQQQLSELESQLAELKAEIATLQSQRKKLFEQVNQTQTALEQVIQESLAQLEQRKQSLQIAVEQLERRQERIRAEMRTTFAGVSQDLAIRVQGFKDYLTGSLQDLAAAAEQLQIAPKASKVKEEPAEIPQAKPVEELQPAPQFAEPRFQSTAKQIRRFLDEYRSEPDYYGPPWKLRRTFEPVHAERAANWFFTQGGRGALRTMGSRLQNILIASAVISVLHELHGDRLRTLILANTPERLGDWRRGLQDCLGISRPDFGPDRGVGLFETPEAVAVKAERLVKSNFMPLIIIDDSEDKISLGLLQFPLWLAFAPDPQRMAREREYDF